MTHEHDTLTRAELQQEIAALQAQLAAAQTRIVELESEHCPHLVGENDSREMELRMLWQAVNQSSSSIVITDSQGNIEYVNPYFTAVTGYTLQEVIGRNPRILKSGFTTPEEFTVLWDTITSGREWSGIFRNKKKDGSLYWEYARIAPVESPDGQITHFIAIKEDITERKQAEEALTESETRFRTLVSSSDDIIFTLDRDGRHTGVYGRWLQRRNLTPAMFLGRTASEILGWENTDAHDSANARALQGQSVVYEWTTESCTIQISLSPLYDDQGRITGLVGIGRDVTERKSLEQQLADYNEHLEALVEERTAQLQRSNERMHTILNNVSNPILLVNAHGHIEIINAALTRTLGYTANALYGRPLWEIFEKAQQPPLMHLFEAAQEHGVAGPMYCHITTREGTSFDAEISFSEVADSSGQIVCTLYDISHLKAVERIKDQFISMVNHELRIPLSSVMLSAGNLLQYYERLNDDQKREKISQIIQQTQTLSEMVTSILDLSRIEAGQAKRGSNPVNVRKALQTVIGEMSAHAEAKQQHLNVQICNSTVVMSGEHSDVVRIWRNLLSNAIKYTGHGGQISARLYGAGNDHQCPLPDLSAFNGHIPEDIGSGRYIIGIVEDNGHGISDEDLEQLFTRFFRGWAVNTSITGTGLGLVLVRDLLHLYEGGIAVHSQLGLGSTFCFWLPVDATGVHAQ